MPTTAGIYQVEVEATQGAENLGTNHAAFQVQDRPVEFYDAALDTRFLQSVASSTDGRYYPLSKMGDVPDDAQYVEGETSFVEQKELWDVPFSLCCCARFSAANGSGERRGALHEFWRSLRFAFRSFGASHLSGAHFITACASCRPSLTPAR